MILIETGQPTQAAFEDAMVFASQLQTAGIAAYLASETMPQIEHAGPKYEGLPFLRATLGQEISQLIVIGANTPHEQKLSAIRKYKLKATAQLVLVGRFSTRQAEISAASRYAYVTDKTPVIHNLDETEGSFAKNSNAPCYGTKIVAHNRAFVADRRPILLHAPNLEKVPGFRAIQMMSLASQFEPVILTSGKSKAAWMSSQSLTTRMHAYNEMTPAVMCRQSDIMILASAIGSNTRMLTAMNNQILSGGIVIDVTGSGAIAQSNPSVLRGPSDFSYLAEYLKEMVLPSQAEIAAESQTSRYAMGLDLGVALKTIGLRNLAKATAPKARPKSQRKTVFLPTNGVGLGHAQRCTLIAAELPKAKTNPKFMAFPSCLPMIRRFGFDAAPLVQRSNLHKERGANDLVNYTRLSATTAPGDTLVFDGGYVFDSVYRTILNQDLNAVWIRRGLWSSQQDNRIPLSRETAFRRVLIPTEAFEDLNQRYSEGSHIHEVGPIVQKLGTPAVALQRICRPMCNQSATRLRRAKTRSISSSSGPQRRYSRSGTAGKNPASWPHSTLACWQMRPI